MNKYIIGMILVIALAIPSVSAYDSSSPYTVTLDWDVPSDTTFSVALAGAEPDITFTCTAATEDLVEPDSQSASGSTPIAVIDNDGNVAMDFSCNLTAAKPSWAVLIVNDVNTHIGGDTFDTTAVEFGDNIAIAGSSDMYLWSNVTSAALGNTAKTIQINGYSHV